ncbi:MAG: hypothetical protein L3J28_14660 [Candidatus Polarisedimenticolaceae bacterium]|nr:hypothetical protein [Candidatus Polarisedimenticolaceae bacterium]
MRHLILTALLLLLFSNPAAADNHIRGDIEEPSGGNTALAITGGCVGGALIGSAIPIFGNIAGCIIGGVASWWYSSD